MGLLNQLLLDVRGLSSFSKKTIQAGLILGLGCLLCRCFALWLAPHAINFAGTMQAARGFGEAAPACVAAAVCAALICDLVIKHDLAKK